MTKNGTVCLGSALISIFPLPFFWISGVHEPVFRWSGLYFQLWGIGTVFWGISETRSLFDLPPFTIKIKNWVARFILLQPPRVYEFTSTGGMTFGGAGKVSFGRAKKMTADERLIAVENRVEEIYSQLRENLKDSEERVRDLSTELNRESEIRKGDDAKIQDKLKKTATGGNHISMIGAAWLIAGLFLSTLAPAYATFVPAIGYQKERLFSSSVDWRPSIFRLTQP